MSFSNLWLLILYFTIYSLEYYVSIGQQLSGTKKVRHLSILWFYMTPSSNWYTQVYLRSLK
jgi:hypothetical protein